MKQPILTVLALAATAPVLFAANFITTGVYDENTTAANVVDATAPASNISLSAFTSLVGTAFSNNRGGVIDFENANGVPAALLAGSNNAFTASYGPGQLLTLTISNPDPAGVASSNWNTNSNNTPVSGLDYLGQSSAVPSKFRFSTPLESFGITVVYRGADRTITPTVFFADNTSFTGASFLVGGVGAVNGGAGQTPDIFFGYTSPSNLITGIDLAESANGFFRMDDLAFVVPVPEPSALGLTGLGAVMLLKRRRPVRA